MFNLGVLLEDDDPASGKEWYERATAADNRDATRSLRAP
jgi:hypothetical protein